jgi:hypothetical protein
VGDRAILGSPDRIAALDRGAQTLPIPLGGLAPAHRRPTAVKRMLGRHRSAPLIAAALLAAGIGIWLSTSTRSFDVGQDATGIHIDDMTLAPTGQSVAGLQVFTGAATVAVVVTPSRLVRAGAVMTWNGLHATGRCVLARSGTGATETCAYVIGATRLTSVDTYIAGTRAWSRRYGDGVEIAIHVPRGSTLIPVPFPLGR